MGDHTIDNHYQDTNVTNDKLCEAVEEGELRLCGRIESSECDLRWLLKKECDV